MKMNEDQIGLYQKLMHVKAELPTVTKNAVNTEYHNQYVTLHSVLSLIEPTLKKYGLYLEQPQEIRDSLLVQVSRIVDTQTGAYCESMLAIDPDLTAHQVCGASTYYRRYTLLGLLALAAEDDDGITATRRPPENPSPERKQFRYPKSRS
jgi:hypothetical protein